MPASTSAPDAMLAEREAAIGDADSVPLGSLIGDAVADARALVTAEIELGKARIAERANAYKGAVTFFAVAGVLALAALIALLVGMILSLATLIGPGWATAAVVGGTLLIAGILALIGKKRLAPPKIRDLAP